MPTFRPIKKMVLSREVEKQIRQSILNGTYSPGDKLPPERELVQKLKVSRVTVREALKNLATLHSSKPKDVLVFMIKDSLAEIKNLMK